MTLGSLFGLLAYLHSNTQVLDVLVTSCPGFSWDNRDYVGHLADVRLRAGPRGVLHFNPEVRVVRFGTWVRISTWQLQWT